MKNRNAIISKVNRLLIKQFGVPARSKTLPDPLDLLIATILSQNTNDNNSYRAFQNLRGRYKSWDELADEKRVTIEGVIRVAGLARQKSGAIKNLLNELNKKGSLSLNFIKDLDNDSAIGQLTEFKGVGVKTASCVLLFALGKDVCPVDTHVHRTVNRIGITSEKTPDKTFFALNIKFPTGIAHSFHTNLIRLGREICKPTKPNCGICPLVKLCMFKEKNMDVKAVGRRRDFMLLDNVNDRH
ncbi:endonuclease III [bacterium]|nr:endonuclease III [bacterium]